MSNELNCRMGKDELTWSGAWWRRQSCGWLVHWLGNASFSPSVLLCFLSWSWFLVSGNFENENVRKNGLLNAFLLLSSSFLLLCEWFVPVLLVFIDLLCSLRYVSVRLLFAERQTKTMIYEVRALPSPVFWVFSLDFAPVPPILGLLRLLPFFSSSESSVVRGEGGAPWVTCFLLYGLLWLTRERRRAPLFLLEETGAQILLFPGSVFFQFCSCFSPPVPQFFFFSRLSLFLLLVIPPLWPPPPPVALSSSLAL